MGLITNLFFRKNAVVNAQRAPSVDEQAKQFSEDIDSLVNNLPPERRTLEALKLVIRQGTYECFRIAERYVKAANEKERVSITFLIHCEFFYFFMHLTNRFLYSKHGEKVGRQWQDERGTECVSDFLNSSVGHWPQHLRDGMRLEMFDKLNATEMEYSPCRSLWPAGKDAFTENSLFGKLRSNVSKLTGDTDLTEQFCIVDGALQIFLRMNLQERVNQAAITLGSRATAA